MMGVFIKGMEMPQKCGQCKLYHAEYPMYCLAVEGYRTVGAPYGMPRPDWCPLVEIKEPHGRMIDADKLAKYKYENIWTNRLIIDADDLDDAQTVIEAEE